MPLDKLPSQAGSAAPEAEASEALSAEFRGALCAPGLMGRSCGPFRPELLLDGDAKLLSHSRDGPQALQEFPPHILSRRAILQRKSQQNHSKLRASWRIPLAASEANFPHISFPQGLGGAGKCIFGIMDIITTLPSSSCTWRPTLRHLLHLLLNG